MKLLKHAIWFFSALVSLNYIAPSAQGDILFSSGSHATGSVTNSEDFEGSFPQGVSGNDLSTASGFHFAIPQKPDQQGFTSLSLINAPQIPGITKSLYAFAQRSTPEQYLTLSLATGASIEELELDIGNGFVGMNGAISLTIQAYDHGVFTGFDFKFLNVPAGTFSIIASGTTFNEIRIGSSVPNDTDFIRLGLMGAPMIDNIKVFSSVDVSPVPEPSTVAMLSLGGLVAYAAKRRRSRLNKSRHRLM